MKYDMSRARATSGRILGEDGEVYNLVDLLKNVGGGGMDPEEYYTKDGVDDLLNKKANASALKEKVDKAALEALEKRIKALEDAAAEDDV